LSKTVQKQKINLW